MGMNLATWLKRLADHECDFTTFVRHTREDWERLANTLIRRWRAGGVSVEDVVQDLLIAVEHFVPKFDSSRGKTLVAFVVFNACAAAKRELHRMRGVSTSGSPDKRKSPTVIPFEFYTDCGRIGMFRHHSYMREEVDMIAWRNASSLMPPPYRCIFDAIETTRGDIDAAVSVLNRDAQFRARHRILGDSDMLRMINDALTYASIVLEN
jgi:DNA-directed RNA polymerase specialized sigma24 family protein